MNETILKALNWRYAVQKFDQSKKVNDADLQTILESGRLAPSSNGFEPWKFLVIENKELRQKISDAGFSQPKITEAPVLIVVTYRTDANALPAERISLLAKVQGQSEEELGKARSYYEDFVAAKTPEEFASWSKAQSYIALGIMIETATLLGIDTGPMDGFMPDGVDAALGLPAKNLRSSALLALGCRAEEPTRPKARRAAEDVIEYVR
jgi:nitroreductase